MHRLATRFTLPRAPRPGGAHTEDDLDKHGPPGDASHPNAVGEGFFAATARRLLNRESRETTDFAQAAGPGLAAKLERDTVRKLRGQGLSTGQAASYCLVSSATIVNWIKAGKIPAQRTVGGQYRIHRGDLRSFMVQTGMRTEGLDHELRPFCWEVVGCGDAPPCDTCPVRIAAYPDCFEARKRSDIHPRCVQNCEDCIYYIIWSKHP